MSSQRTPPIPIDNARDMLLDSIIPIEELEVISLDQAYGRIAGETLLSKVDLPSTQNAAVDGYCLLYTSPSPRDAHESRMPSSA